MLINGVDRTSHLEQEAWDITQNFGRQGDTANFTLIDELTTTAPTFVVHPLSEVQLTDVSLGVVLFSGIVTNPVWTQISPTLIQWQLSCKDWTIYADNIIVNGIFEGQTASAIVKSLTTQANVGLTTNNVESAPVIDRIKINFKSLSAALTKVAKMASQTSNYGWFFDENKDLHFFNEQQQSTSQATFTDSISSNPTTTLGYYDNNSMNYEYDGSAIRNSCIVRGATYTGNWHDKFVGNGHQTSWPLSFQLNTNAQGNTNAGILVNGVSQSLQVINSPTDTVSAQWILTQSANSQWFLQTGTVGTPQSGAQLTLTYPYTAPVIARSDNTVSQATIGGSNGGVYQMYVADPAITSLTAAQARANAELHQYQWVQERVSFTTTEGFPGHVRGGDVITFANARVPNSQNSYNAGINNNFLIIQNHIQGANGSYRTYSITGTRVS